jgi:nucleoside-diphosphate-sugar epimerase
MAERKRTVLVTGSSGFIGSAIAARLPDRFD